MTIIFKAKTTDGFIFKILAELLQTIIKTACLKIHQRGINLCMMDTQQKILVDIQLKAGNFNTWELNYPQDLYLGINLNYLHKMLKSIKKKDSLLLSINDDKIDELILTVYPKENNRITTSYVHIQSIQNIEYATPTDYINSVIVPSNEYQRALKNMNNISDKIQIEMCKNSINISCCTDNIFARNVMFGELDDTSAVCYCELFDMELMIRTLKIAGLSKNLKIFHGPGMPLLINSQVGLLGDIYIYIKSKKQIDT
jgi:proliferating cell nuclear antigen PCNA